MSILSLFGRVGFAVGLFGASLRSVLRTAFGSPSIPHAIAFLLIILNLSSTYAQDGFIRRVALGTDALRINSLLEDNDTLVVMGSCWDSTYSMLQGIFIAKIDTNGNLIQKHVLWDSTATLAIGVSGRFLIKTSDGGYMAIYGHYGTNIRLLTKFNHELEIEFTKQFNIILPVSLPVLQEIPGGYLMCGMDYLEDEFNTMRTFVRKIDKQGNLLWTKLYQGYGTWTYQSSFIKVSDNEFVMSGQRNSPELQTNDTYQAGWMCSIDTFGVQNWEWVSDSSARLQSLFGLQQTPDGGWLAASSNIWHHNNSPFNFSSWCGFVKLNADREIEWRDSIGPKHAPYFVNGLYETAATIDGNYVGVGRLHTDSLDANGAFMACVSLQGDSLWVRTDTLMTPSVGKYLMELYSVVTLSSGSIIACGYAQNPVGKDFGLLIKTDPRGCIEPDCHPYVTIIDDSEDPEGIVFGISPNPTSGLLRIHTGSTATFSAAVYDGAGRVLAQKEAMHSGETLDISGVPSGQYFVRIRTAGSQTVVHSVIRI